LYKFLNSKDFLDHLSTSPHPLPPSHPPSLPPSLPPPPPFHLALDGGRDCLPHSSRAAGRFVLDVCHGGRTVGRDGRGGRGEGIQCAPARFLEGEVPDNPEPSHIFPPSSKQGPSLLPSLPPFPPHDRHLQRLHAGPLARPPGGEAFLTLEDNAGLFLFPSLPCSFFSFSWDACICIFDYRYF
jgi:hypothetical protein